MPGPGEAESESTMSTASQAEQKDLHGTRSQAMKLERRNTHPAQVRVSLSGDAFLYSYPSLWTMYLLNQAWKLAFGLF